MKQVDIIVLGGGPAGAAAARAAAQRGATVVVVERNRMPRFKACGGALSEQAMAYLDFAIPEEFVDWQVFGARVHFGERSVEARLDERIAVLVTRSRFDHFLLLKAEEAGAEVLWDEAKSVEADASGVLVRTGGGRIRAECAIICEGANRRLSRVVRPKDRPWEQGFCIEAEIPVGSADSYADLVGLIDLYFGLAGQGYGWVFHHGTYYSVGVGGLCSSFSSPLAVFHRFIRQRGLNSPDMKPVGHFIPCGGVSRKVHAGRLLLAGDAAGFVDSFYGEGIAYAIKSGHLAAQTAVEALAGRGFSSGAMARYGKACHKAFDRNLRYSLLLTRLMHGCPSVFIRLLSSDERVLRKYLLVPSMKWSYKQYLWWLLPRVPLFLLSPGDVPPRG